MAHVFISYSKKDNDYTRKLVDRLRDEGFDVWIDDRQLSTSEDWWTAIVKAIWSCSAFIVILTPNSDQSRWVQREITLADDRGKPMFPLLLKGDLNTPNWALLVRTQYEDVRDRKLPGAEFFDDLERVAPRRDERGKNLNETGQQPAVEIKNDQVFEEAIHNPPPVDEDDPERPTLPNLLLALAGLLAVAIMVVAGVFFLTRDDPPMPDVTPTPPPVFDLNAAADLAVLNAWREAEGYPALTPNETLNNLADRQLAYLSSLSLDQLPSIIRVNDADNNDIRTVACDVGYEKQVQMFVEITETGFSLDDLLLKLDADGRTIDGQDVQGWAQEVGLAQARSPDTDTLYFILILGGNDAPCA